MYAVLPVVWSDLGLELWMVGVLLSANRFVRLLTNPFAGWVVERVGMSAPFKASVLASAAITCAYALPGFALLLLLRASWGLCWSFLRLGAYLAALENSNERTRGLTLGFSSGLVSVGTLVAMAFGGFVTDAIGFSGAVICCGVLAGVGGLAFLPEHAWPQHLKLAHGETRRTLSAAVVERLRVERAGRWSLYALSVVNAAAGGGIVVATLGLHLVQRYGAELSLFGVLLGAASLNGVMLAMRFGASLVLAPVGGRLSDRVGRTPTLLASAGGVVVCLAALSLPTSLEATLAVTVALFFAATVVRISLDAAAGDAAPTEARPRVMSAYANATDLGSALGPFLAYPLAEAFGLSSVYRGACLLLLLAGSIAALALRSRARA